MKAQKKPRRLKFEFNPKNYQHVNRMYNMLCDVHSECTTGKFGAMRNIIRSYGLRGADDLNFLKNINLIDNRKFNGRNWEWICNELPSMDLARELVAKVAAYRKNQRESTPAEQKVFIAAFQRQMIDQVGNTVEAVTSDEVKRLRQEWKLRMMNGHNVKQMQFEQTVKDHFDQIKSRIETLFRDMVRMENKMKYDLKPFVAMASRDQVEIPVLWGLFKIKANLTSKSI
jgi:hypothetical protein